MNARGEGEARACSASLALPLERLVRPTSGRISSVRSSYTAKTTSSRLSDGRRRKLEDIQNREAIKAKRLRLQALLISKLASKYAGKSSSRRTAIEKMVASFVSKTENVTEASLMELETDVREAMGATSPSAIAPTIRPTTEEEGGASTQEASGEQDMANSSRHGSMDDIKTGKMANNQAIDDWILLDAIHTIEDEEAARQKMAKAMEFRQKLREDLERQITKLEAEKKKEWEGKQALGEKIKVDSEQWANNQEYLRSSLHNRLYAEKEIRLSQISEKDSRSKSEKDERLAREIREIQACQREIARQEENARAKKRAERERQYKIRIENEEENERRKLTKLKEAEEDKRLMEEFAKKLEREEFERANAFKKRVEKMEISGQKWAEEGAGKKMAELERELENIILREAARKEAADDAREKRDKETRRNNLRRMAEENKKMIAEKERLLALERAAESKWTTAFRREGEDFVRKQKENKKQELEKNKKYNELLLKQVEEQERHRKALIMTDVERKLNSKALKRLQDDGELVTKIYDKLLGTAKFIPSDSPIGIVNMDV